MIGSRCLEISLKKLLILHFAKSIWLPWSAKVIALVCKAVGSRGEQLEAGDPCYLTWFQKQSKHGWIEWHTDKPGSHMLPGSSASLWQLGRAQNCEGKNAAYLNCLRNSESYINSLVNPQIIKEIPNSLEQSPSFYFSHKLPSES